MGKWERTLLRASAEVGRKRTIAIPPPGLTNSQRTAVRRAVKTLREAGLAELAMDEDDEPVVTPVFRGGRLVSRERHLFATRLGHAVVDACAYDWEAGRPGRWIERLPKVKRSILDECGCLHEAERGPFT